MEGSVIKNETKPIYSFQHSLKLAVTVDNLVIVLIIKISTVIIRFTVRATRVTTHSSI